MAHSKVRVSNQPIVIASIDGGLGNQMFQYAFSRTVADRRSGDLLLDMGLLEQARRGVTPRCYSLNAFNVRAVLCKGALFQNRLKIFLLKKLPILSRLLGVRLERGHGFQNQAASDHSSRYFKGYWQSHRYFSENAAQIFQDFKPKENLSIEAVRFLKLIELTQSVMIHVRRSDYLSSPITSSYHFSLDVEYYKSAYVVICTKIANPTFFIFSDDIEWSKDALSFIDKPIRFIPPNFLKADWEDLIVMSHCKHHIIANSSFSWWSAWLADQRHGVDGRFVAAPLRWFAKETIDPHDRFPNHWIVF